MDQNIKGIYTPNPFSVKGDTSLHDCIELMGSRHVSSLIVTHDKKPVGIFTEADIVRTINLKLGRNQATNEHAARHC